MVTKLEEDTQKLIAYKLITSITGTISDRAKRKYEKIGIYIGGKLKGAQKIPEDSNLRMDLKWSDEAVGWARKMSLGIREFKNEYPKYGKLLEEKIAKHKDGRRAYLEFGLKKGKIPEEIYLEVINEIIPGISETKAKEFYNFIKELNQALKKKERGLQKFLLPE